MQELIYNITNETIEKLRKREIGYILREKSASRLLPRNLRVNSSRGCNESRRCGSAGFVEC